MVETRWPEYREGCREPFSVIGQKAYGSKMKHFVAVNILVQLFGVVVVFLLLAAELVYDLLSSQVTQVTLCDWIIILALLMLPFTWFGSPMDIPLIAYAAMSCTAVSCVLLVILFFQESTELAKVDHGNITLKSAFLSLGTILFAFGGAATFPTFQNDMKNKSNFPWAVAIGFGLMLVLYLPVAGGGYAIYGSKVSSNIVDDVQPGGLTTAIDVLMAFHVLCAFLIVINVVNLSFEHYLGLKHEFNLKRCSFRSFVLLIVIFIGLTVPKFGKILNLVGGSTVSLTSFIMPPIFYMKLADQYCDDWPERLVIA
ncbi:Lysine histidine transporter 1 [Halotydeus destructor]|nr:Lysine histidine transporter 1 [Halotydeus destructor]